MIASENGYTDIVEMLVEKEADVNVKRIGCKTALMIDGDKSKLPEGE